MQLSNLPARIYAAFANAGTKNTIPIPSQIGITNGAASFTDGFPPLTLTPVASGGVPPFGADFNGIFNAITKIQQWQSGGGMFEYDATWSSTNGGYPLGAILVAASGAGYWVNLADNNTTNPDTGGANWVNFSPAALQQNISCISAAAGAADALTASFSPAIAAVTNGMSLMVRASYANATATPTFTPNSGTVTAATIVKGNGLALAAGDIAGAGHWIELQYDATLSKWVLLNPASGVSSPSAFQSISASVASNALTVGLNPGVLQFRNASLTIGVPVNVAIGSALSLTVPSGATLGSLNAVQSQLVLVVLYNGGAPALGIVNIAGGVNLDETTLLSTTAISAGATANNVVYSAAAISNSPFRVVGYVNITEATAGTWATAPTLTQGVGGQALASMQSLGFGQTWQNVLGSRAAGTTYYNTTGRPIFVSIFAPNAGSPNNTAILTINGISVAETEGDTTNGTATGTVSGPVPPGGSYSVALSGRTLSGGIWAELR